MYIFLFQKKKKHKKFLATFTFELCKRQLKCFLNKPGISTYISLLLPTPCLWVHSLKIFSDTLLLNMPITINLEVMLLAFLKCQTILEKNKNSKGFLQLKKKKIKIQELTMSTIFSFMKAEWTKIFVLYDFKKTIQARSLF